MQKSSIVLFSLLLAVMTGCQGGPRTHAPLSFQRSFEVEYTGEVGPGPTSLARDEFLPSEEREAETVEAFEPGDPVAVIETHLVSLDEALARDWFGVDVGTVQAHLVDQQDAGRRLQTLRDHGEVDLLTCPRVTVALGQKGEVITHRQIHYLSGYELEANETARIADPVVSVVQAGLGLEVLPTAHAQEDRLNLEVAMRRVDLVRPIPLVSSPLPGCGVEAELQIPVILQQRVATQADLDGTQSLMIAGLSGEEPDQTVLAFVHVRRVSAEPSPVDAAGG